MSEIISNFANFQRNNVTHSQKFALNNSVFQQPATKKVRVLLISSKRMCLCCCSQLWGRGGEFSISIINQEKILFFFFQKKILFCLLSNQTIQLTKACFYQILGLDENTENYISFSSLTAKHRLITRVNKYFHNIYILLCVCLD